MEARKRKEYARLAFNFHRGNRLDGSRQFTVGQISFQDMYKPNELFLRGYKPGEEYNY
jgi:hypothetical protein